MELKDRKWINNTRPFIPKYGNGKNPYVPGSPQWHEWNKSNAGGITGQIANGTAQNTANATGAATGATGGINVGGITSTIGQGIDFIGNLDNASSYNKSVNQILAEGNINGQKDQFESQRNANTLGLAAKGAALGGSIASVVPGIGTVAGAVVGGATGLLGGIIGGFGAEKEMERKLELAKFVNNQRRQSESQTESFTAMDTRSREKYGNSEDTMLHAYNGKVVSASGRKAKQNAWLSKGEYVWDGRNNLAYVNYGPNDRAKGYVNGKDTVFTNNPDIPAPAGFSTIAQAVPYAAATGQLPALANYQAAVKGYGNYKNGKCASYKCGKISAYDGYPDPRRIAMQGELDPVIVTGTNRYRNDIPVGAYGDVKQLGYIDPLYIPQLAEQYRSNLIADTQKGKKAKGSNPSKMAKASNINISRIPTIQPYGWSRQEEIPGIAETTKAKKAGNSTVDEVPMRQMYNQASRAVQEPTGWNTAMEPIYGSAATTKAARAANSMPSELPMRQLYNQQASTVPQMMQEQIVPNTAKVNMSINGNIPADRIQTFNGDYDRSYAFKWGPQIHDWQPNNSVVARPAANPRIDSNRIETFEQDYGQFPTGHKDDFGGVNWVVPEYETKYNMLTPNRDLAQRMTAPEVKTDLNSRTVGFLPTTMGDFGGVNWAVPSPEQIGTSPYGAEKGNPTVGDPTAYQGPSDFAMDKQANYPSTDTLTDAPEMKEVPGVGFQAPEVTNNLNNIKLPESMDVKMPKKRKGLFDFLKGSGKPKNNGTGGGSGNGGNGAGTGKGPSNNTVGGINMSDVDWGTLIPRGIGMLNAMIGYHNTKNEPVYYQNNYMPNTMGQRALRRMAGNKINAYPILDNLNKQAAYGRTGIARSGGLTALQKQLSMQNLMRNNMDARANALADIQNKNAALSNQLSNAELQYGAQEAQNIMNSKNLADDRYARALAAKRGMLRTYETDMSNNFQRMFADPRNYNILQQMLHTYQA